MLRSVWRCVMRCAVCCGVQYGYVACGAVMLEVCDVLSCCSLCCRVWCGVVWCDMLCCAVLCFVVMCCVLSSLSRLASLTFHQSWSPRFSRLQATLPLTVRPQPLSASRSARLATTRVVQFREQVGQFACYVVLCCVVSCCVRCAVVFEFCLPHLLYFLVLMASSRSSCSPFHPPQSTLPL